MTQTWKLIALSAAIALGGMTVADAKGGHGGQKRPDFSALDTNGDGEITKAELEARGAARFAEADTDGNGALSKDELLARMRKANEKRVDRILERLDTDDNGSISQAEMEAAPRRGGADRLFERADTDDSGTITKEEFDTAMAQRGKRHKKPKSE